MEINIFNPVRPGSGAIAASASARASFNRHPSRRCHRSRSITASLGIGAQGCQRVEKFPTRRAVHGILLFRTVEAYNGISCTLFDGHEGLHSALLGWWMTASTARANSDPGHQEPHQRWELSGASAAYQNHPTKRVNASRKIPSCAAKRYRSLSCRSWTARRNGSRALHRDR